VQKTHTLNLTLMLGYAVSIWAIRWWAGAYTSCFY